MEADPLPALTPRLAPWPARASTDHPAFQCPAAELLTTLRYLRDEAGYSFLCDITATDAGPEAKPRFTVFHHLFHPVNYSYLRLATDCPEAEAPAVASAVSLWAGANWHEREAYDMFGIVFEGHPDLRRILMWESYPYFPLRKDFPLAGRETDLPAPDVVERTGVSVKPAPLMGGPFHATNGQPMSAMEPRGGDQSWTESDEKPAPHAPD